MSDNSGYLYLMHDVLDVVRNRPIFFKVGKTVDPDNRLRVYNSSFPVDRLEYSFVTHISVDVHTAERFLLDKLKEDSRFESVEGRLEWFTAKMPRWKAEDIVIKYMVTLSKPKIK